MGFTERVKDAFESLKFKKPHFSFILAHYMWIIGATIVASILIYAPAHGDLAYIDALSFASGANTQAGLNTVDTNLLNTFQQVVIYLFAMASSPITIHSSVVFLRLHWFEKRFEHIVEDAKQRRVSLSKSRSKAIPSAADVEKGVNGRHITVVPNSAAPSRLRNGNSPEHTVVDESLTKGDDSASSSNEPAPRPAPQIHFSDQVKRSDVPESAVKDDEEEEEIPLPSKRSDAEHIAILERQRKGDKDKGTLRIPGPRDVERGVLPEEVDDTDVPNGHRRGSSNAGPIRPGITHTISHSDRPQTITIAEPARHPRENRGSQGEVNENGTIRSRHQRSYSDAIERTDTGSSSALQRSNRLQRFRSALSQREEQEMPYLSWQPTVGRNSAFLGLTEEQREELGGIEYRSLKTLVWFLLTYFWGYTILGMITMVPWIVNNNQAWGPVVDDAGVSRVWWGFFTANSALMDLGYTLTPDSMNSFNTATYPLMWMSFFIILGNTGFPIMLRFMIWATSLVVPRESGLWEELRFLLDHPRRCFTLLFPSNATWWLFFILVVLNGLDLILFIILDLNSGTVDQLPLGVKFLDGWFQATSTRTAGFSCINLAYLHPAVQCSYLIMMYISIFPIAISIRRTNVYEEKSLGVYNTPDDVDDQQQSSFSYVGTHLRRQLSFDLWYVFLAFFILSISEGGRIMSGDFSQFAILFEIVSAYGTIGLSLGYPTVNTSLCGQFSIIGKLVIIALEIRGRHRGLPYGLDRAVLLPSERLDRKEAEDNELRLQRLQTAMSGDDMGRTMSLGQTRTRSFGRGRVLTGFLAPGPAIPRSRSSQTSYGVGRTETLSRYPSAATGGDVEPSGRRMSAASDRPNRAQTTPAAMSG